MSRKSDIWFFDIIKPVAATLIVFHITSRFLNAYSRGLIFMMGFLILDIL